MKKYGEENNYIDSKRFSGFGMKDPTLRLKLLAKQQKHMMINMGDFCH